MELILWIFISLSFIFEEIAATGGLKSSEYARLDSIPQRDMQLHNDTAESVQLEKDETADYPSLQRTRNKALLHIDKRIESRINPGTKAIYVDHYAGMKKQCSVQCIDDDQTHYITMFFDGNECKTFNENITGICRGSVCIPEEGLGKS